MVCIRTSIAPELKRRVFLRGLPLTALGALIILYYGSRGVTPLGAVVFIAALGMIAVGLRPYRKLCRLELAPDELAIEEGRILFIHRSKVQFAIPLKEIRQVSYLDRLVLRTDDGDICFSHFDEEACHTLQTRLHDVVEFDHQPFSPNDP